MVDKMKASIEEKYGKPFDHWVDMLRTSGLEKHGQMIKLLKTDHGFSHGFANLVAHVARESSALDKPADDLVSAQYSSGKEHLKSWYDEVIKEIKKLGSDVEIAPKKNYVSLRRKKQFGLIQPSTKTRLDIGINLKGKDPEGNLILSGSWNGMVSHRVKVTAREMINQDLFNWLAEAYNAAG